MQNEFLLRVMRCDQIFLKNTDLNKYINGFSQILIFRSNTSVFKVCTKRYSKPEDNNFYISTSMNYTQLPLSSCY